MTARPRIYQLLCLVLAVAVLLGASWPAQTRFAEAKRDLLGGDDPSADVGQLDSFALTLLLGGFRGPLVMYLWVAGEEEKNREDTEKFLTRSEFIGTLQPQFVPVYVHQSWNLAYNISVQYNRPSEKYRWITEGIEFAEKGERRVPGNTDILVQLGHLYFDKLGESFERDYYRTRFRRNSMDRLLTADRYLKAEYAERWQYIDRLDAMIARARQTETEGDHALVDRMPPGPDAARHDWPYGVSVYAIAYDYYKQAAQPGMDSHSTFGDSVVSSRPAIAVRAWVDEEMNLAFDAEAVLWSWDDELPVPNPIAFDGPEKSAALDAALFHYAEQTELALLARAEYFTHIQEWEFESRVFTTHITDTHIKSAIGEAGVLRLAGLRDLVTATSEAERAGARRRLDEARVLYRKTARDIDSYMKTEYRDVPDYVDPTVGSHGQFYRLGLKVDRAIEQIDSALAAWE